MIIRTEPDEPEAVSMTWKYALVLSHSLTLASCSGLFRSLSSPRFCTTYNVATFVSPLQRKRITLKRRRQLAGKTCICFSLDNTLAQPEGEKLILWRGENTEGYSMELRHVEFTHALSAVLGSYKAVTNVSIIDDLESSSITFTNALTHSDYNNFTININGTDSRSNYHLQAFQGAMQYVHIQGNDHKLLPMTLPRICLQDVTHRSSLIRSSFEIVAVGETYFDIVRNAMNSRLLDDMMISGNNKSWCVRHRQLGPSAADPNKAKRYGKRIKSSLSLEREAVEGMYDLLIHFQGPVQLNNPDCKLYLFEGLIVAPSTHPNIPKMKVLARKLADGLETSNLAPKTRICKTNTPLCPIAAYVMCNIAQIRSGYSVLDLYAGSGAILLAATRLATLNTSYNSHAESNQDIKTVGIDIAHEGLINREDLLHDFITRNLRLPLRLIQGDSSSYSIRQEARDAIHGSFDAIIVDPPYGIRESLQSSSELLSREEQQSPITQLVSWIAHDREYGQPLLKKGGRLIAFVPVLGEYTLDERSSYLPEQNLLQRAGLKLIVLKEQVLNDVLSRWLVAYECIA